MIIENKVHWALDKNLCALLIHDMQTHYLTALPSTLRSAVIAHTRTVAHACMEREIPIFASQVPLSQQSRERGLMLDMWGKGPASGDQTLHPDLGLDTDVIRPLTKRSYSAFYGNDLEVMLRRLGRDSLLIVGVYTSIGCQCSAMDAFMRDIRPFVIADATADFNLSDHQAGLAHMSRLCARVIDTDMVCESLNTFP